MAKYISRHSIESSRLAGSEFDKMKTVEETLRDVKDTSRKGEQNPRITNTRGYKGSHRA